MIDADPEAPWPWLVTTFLLGMSLEEAVTVVEWGAGLAEALAEDRLEVEILRAHGEEAGETRTLTVRAVGPRWAGVDLDALRDA